MNTFILRSMSSFLALIGLLIGFTSKVMAQYGAPPSFFKITGKIQSSETFKPIPKIQVSLTNTQSGYKISTKTDTLGIYNFSTNGRYRIDDEDFMIKVEDLDGKQNGGDFDTISEKIKYVVDEQKIVNFLLKNKGIVNNRNNNNVPIFDLVILPSSTKGQFTIKYNVSKIDPITFIVYNNLGGEIYNKKIDIKTGKGKYKIQLNNPAKGTYAISLIQNDAIISKKITIK